MIRWFSIFILVGLLAISACSGQSNTPIPDEASTTPIASPTDPATTPSESTRPSQQTSEVDMVKDILQVEYVAQGYTVESVLPSSFGLSRQLALLPNGDVVITDLSFQRLQILSNGNLSTLIGRGEVQANAVATMPDGRILYMSPDNHLILFEPNNRSKEILGDVPSGERVQALAADNSGNAYAVTKNNRLYQFNTNSERRVITADLPFEQRTSPTISDMDVAPDGTIYVSGFNYFVAVNSEGSLSILADDLDYAPTWCEIAPDGKVYVKDISSGIRQVNPATGELISVKINVDTGVGDLLAVSADEFIIFFRGTDAIYEYNLKTNEATPLFIHTVNNRAFAADASNGVFLATPDIGPALDPYIIRIKANGEKQNLAQLTFTDIQALDVDDENRLNLYADGKFYRLEADGSVTTIIPKYSSGPQIRGNVNMAVSLSGLLYCISTDHNDSIRVWSVAKDGNAVLLPISFNRASFSNSYRLSDARIDVGNDGRLAIIITALGSKGQGPFYQRVYQADADGKNLTEIANFDSKRIGGMVDIAVDHDNNIFVLALKAETTGSGEAIYRIGNDLEISTFLEIRGGRDPKSIDIDPYGNLWFGTTVGVFMVTRSR